jgi:hypothetical protein
LFWLPELRSSRPAWLVIFRLFSWLIHGEFLAVNSLVCILFLLAGIQLVRVSLLQMTPFGDNPFAVLTTVVAPAVLTNACSVLCLGTSNRIARVVDRSREVAGHLKALTADSPERRPWEQQLNELRARARYLFWALRLLYASLGAFAAAALVAVLGSVVAASALPYAFRAIAILGLAVGTVGVGGLAAGCLLMVQEVRLALKQTADEAEAAMASGSGSLARAWPTSSATIPSEEVTVVR